AGTDIDPTPVIGTVGLIDHLARRPPGMTLRAGSSLVLVGSDVGEGPSLAGSRWAVECRAHRNGTLPPLDLALHGRLVAWVGDLVGEVIAGRVDGDQHLVEGIHDVSGGGLGLALAEMAVRSGLGFVVGGIPDHRTLFTETPSRVVVCTDRPDELMARAAASQLGAWVLGSAGGDRLVVEGLVDVGLDDATTAWRDRLPALLDELAPAEG
ncbi:MAG TPA: AIR synthase-related protein, partial [Acidimicrobiales bacterium]